MISQIRLTALLVAIGATAAPGASPAQTASGPAASAEARKSDELGALCTDRPTKSNFACTVEAGHVQYETDLVNGGFQRAGGVGAQTYLIPNPTLKVGLSGNVDLEANLAPLELLRTHERGTADHTIAGVGDLYLRAKYLFVNTKGGVFEATLLPYVKLPTAGARLGNRAVEGGMVIPVNYKINDLLLLTLDPEVDALKDASGPGRHLNTAQLVNLAVTLPHSFTLYSELWSDWNFDPLRTSYQASADVALAFAATKYLQLDGGLNVGLNRATPNIQAYIGVSQKF